MKKESFNDHSSPTFQVSAYFCKAHVSGPRECLISSFFFSMHSSHKKKCEACIKFLTMYRKLTKHKMTILWKMNTLGEVPEPIFPGDEIFLNMWLWQQWLTLGQVPFESCIDILLLNQTNSNTMTQRRELESNTEVNLGSLI